MCSSDSRESELASYAFTQLFGFCLYLAYLFFHFGLHLVGLLFNLSLQFACFGFHGLNLLFHLGLQFACFGFYGLNLFFNLGLQLACFFFNLCTSFFDAWLNVALEHFLKVQFGKRCAHVSVPRSAEAVVIGRNVELFEEITQAGVGSAQFSNDFTCAQLVAFGSNTQLAQDTQAFGFGFADLIVYLILQFFTLGLDLFDLAVDLPLQFFALGFDLLQLGVDLILNHFAYLAI
ncbi:Hypothetical protein HDN1F_31980 [gamma proteobacterium HdN1]|nr:Hypothetical protein HDN1F_31980 [gamma proteobacterium HdN1]